MVDKAMDAYNGVMKICSPAISTKNPTPTKLSSILKHCRKHFDSVMNSPNPRNADTELYIVQDFLLNVEQGTQHMVDRLKEPLSYYMYKRRNPDMRRVINYSSIMERAIRNPRNNRSVIETETNEDSQEAETKNGGPRKYRRRYKGAGEIIKEAKDETNTKKVMSTPMRAKSEKRRANASLRLRPNIKETVKLSQQTLIVSYYTILPFKTQLYNRMQNASNTQ
eukprot:TRINITY_DN764_c0_g1_i1.p1 TRINITY_DN764_c0_g1~~TRINITY_DN764_c0_g1_i1.p1  ORF type:complete len:223 (+),score=10.43 TRINITY_DN764_c0_g1_i1:326-994(+)